MLAKTEQKVTGHLVGDLLSNIESAYAFIAANPGEPKTEIAFEVSYIRLVQHTHCLRGSEKEPCGMPCCRLASFREVVRCSSHHAMYYSMKVATWGHFFSYLSFMLRLLFEIKYAFNLPENETMETVFRPLISMSSPSLEIVRIVTDCFLILVRRRSASTFAAVYNDKVVTKVDISFHSLLFQQGSAMRHWSQEAGQQLELRTDKGRLMVPVTFRQIVQYVNEEYNRHHDLQLLFSGLKLMKRMLAGGVVYDAEERCYCVETYTRILAAITEGYVDLILEMQKLVLKRLRFITSFVLLHQRQSAPEFCSFSFYKRIVCPSLVQQHGLVVPVYYAILRPYIETIIKRAPELVSLLGEVGLLAFAGETDSPAAKRAKYDGPPTCKITLEGVMIYVQERAKEISATAHFAYEDAVAVLADILCEANGGDKNAIALATLILHPYDSRFDFLFSENLRDPRDSFISTHTMLLTCAKVLFRGCSVSNVLSVKASTCLISILKRELVYPDMESSFHVRIAEGLLLYDIAAKDLTDPNLREAIQGFTNSLWKKEDRPARFMTFSVFLPGLLSRYMELSQARFSTCMRTLAERMTKFSGEKVLPELFMNYVDVVCYFLLYVICKLHRRVEKGQRQSRKTAGKSSAARPKAVEAVYVQKYCNYCGEEMGQRNAKPRHWVKCHVCGEKNLALLMPVFHPCEICERASLYKDCRRHILNQSPRGGLRCGQLKEETDLIEDTLDDIVESTTNELYIFVDKNGAEMSKCEHSCYDFASRTGFNNEIYAHTRMLEVVNLYLRHAHGVTRKQKLLDTIAKIHKRTQNLR